MEEKDYEENVQKKGQPKLKELNTVGEKDIRRNQNSSLNRQKGRRHQAGRNSEKMENKSVDHQHTTQPILLW